MTKVFVSYSHVDRKWKDRVVKHLNVPTVDGANSLAVWDDAKIQAGSDWLQDIRTAIYESQVALLLVSADFLTSKFVLGTEVPELLSLRSKEGLKLLPLVVHDCAWQKVSWLAPLQARPSDGKPLALLTKARAESALAELATEIVQAIQKNRSQEHSRTGLPPNRSVREEALRSRLDAEFEDLLASDYVVKGLSEKLENITKGKYAPLSALIQSVDARIEHEILPIIEGMINIETKLRSKHRMPFTDESISALRQRVTQAISDRWDFLVSRAALDAENHVFHSLNMFPSYKEKELHKLANDIRNSTDYRGALAFVENLLKKALADSILSEGS